MRDESTIINSGTIFCNATFMIGYTRGSTNCNAVVTQRLPLCISSVFELLVYNCAQFD